MKTFRTTVHYEGNKKMNRIIYADDAEQAYTVNGKRHFSRHFKA